MRCFISIDHQKKNIMGQNGQDKSGNAFKYSLIPLMLGIVVIFFLYRGCDSGIFEAQPIDGTAATNTVIEDEIAPERPIQQETTTATEVVEDVAVENDTLQAAE